MSRILKILRNNKGITLIELTIVLTILAIIGAIVVPNFFGITDRARARSDIQSTVIIRNAFELYRLERGSAPAGANANAVLETLYGAGFLSSPLTDDDPQTNEAVWVLEDGAIMLTLPNGIFSSVSSSLSDHERSVLTNP